jgi:hypothetical protein
MSVHQYMSELDSLNKELTRLNKQLRDVRKQKEDIVNKVIEYLEKSGKSGIRYNGVVVSLQKDIKRDRKKMGEKKMDCKGVLEKYGIRNSDKMVEEIIESQKGAVANVSKLKINK